MSKASSGDIQPKDAIKEMMRGAPLLKFGRKGAPHFRNFQLSRDACHLSWFSKKKRAGDSQVKLTDCELIEGQATDVFQRNQRDDLVSVSFSLRYPDPKKTREVKTLDIACKDQREFQLWKLGLSFIISNQKLSPMVLSQAATTEHSSEETGQSKQVNKQISKHLKERMKESNDVYIWGSNAWFQLGLGRDDARPAPSLVNRLLGKAVKQVVCGLQHTVAVTEEGEVFAWGNGMNGRLGSGTANHEMFPRQLVQPFGRHCPYLFRSVACGDSHTVAIDFSGRAFSWGCGAYGALGHASNSDELFPREIASLVEHSMSLCAAGSQYSAFVTSARGQVFTNGYGAGGVLGHGSTAQQQQQQRGDSQGGLGLPDFAAVSGFGADDPLAMLFDGDDHPADARTPLMVDSLAGKQVTAIDCGAYHMGVVTSDSQLFMWGLNAMGQLGTGDCVDRCAPVQISPCTGARVTKIACGASHTICMASVAARPLVFGWGAAAAGQLGHKELPIGDGFAVEDRPGTVYGWHLDALPPEAQEYAQVARAKGCVLLPEEIKLPLEGGDAGVAAACGTAHSVVLTQKGKLYTFGDGEASQLGLTQKRTSGGPNPPFTRFLRPDSGTLAAGEGPHHDSYGGVYQAPVGSTGQTGVDGGDMMGGASLSGAALGNDAAAPTTAQQHGQSWAQFHMGQVLGLQPQPQQTMGGQTQPGSAASSADFGASGVRKGQPERRESEHPDLMLSARRSSSFYAPQWGDDGTVLGGGISGGDSLGPSMPFGQDLPDMFTPKSWVWDDAALRVDPRLNGPAKTLRSETAMSPSRQTRAGSHSVDRFRQRTRSRTAAGEGGIAALLGFTSSAPETRITTPSTNDWVEEREMALPSTAGLGPQEIATLGKREVRGISCGGEHTCATLATEWLQDRETTGCMLCRTAFTMTTRRHHCRKCGGIYCAKCSAKKITLLKLGFVQPVRVCDSCFSRERADQGAM